jgi:hypothetical protein
MCRMIPTLASVMQCRHPGFSVFFVVTNARDASLLAIRKCSGGPNDVQGISAFTRRYTDPWITSRAPFTQFVRLRQRRNPVIERAGSQVAGGHRIQKDEGETVALAGDVLRLQVFRPGSGLLHLRRLRLVQRARSNEHQHPPQRHARIPVIEPLRRDHERVHDNALPSDLILVEERAVSR